MIIKYNTDGSVNEYIGSNVFQNSVGFNSVEIQIDKPQDSIVTISLERADGVLLSAKPCEPKTDNVLSSWTYTFGSYGSPDLVVDGDLYIAFTITKDGVSLNTEQFTGIVQESYSNGFDPVDPSTAEILQEQITQLELKKVGRYDVDDIAEEASIVFEANGYKTPNNLYYNFVNNVIDQLETIEKTGGLLVLANGATQVEWFFTVDKKLYIRTIVGATVGDFIPFTEEDLSSYTYSKAESDLLFVHLLGDETIEGIKTFESAPIVPNASADTHAVNRQTMQGYTYSKEEVDSKFTAISFDTHEHFEEWLAGTYERVDGKLPSDLVIGNKVIIIEQGQNNYQVIETPVVDITDFKILVEDNKNLAEIAFTPQEDLSDTNANDALLEVNRKTNLKTQIVQLADLTVLTTDWALNEGVAYFDYYPAEFTDPLKQKLELNSGDIDTNNALYNEKFVVLSVDNIVDGENLGIRCYANKIPSVDITFTVFLETYVDSLIEQGDITASVVAFNNTGTGMAATNVQSAIVELKGDIGDVASDLSQLDTDLSGDIGDVASDLTTALGGTEGDLFVIGSTGVLEKLPVGEEGQTLKVIDGVPTWVETREVLFENSSGAETVDLSAFTFSTGDVLEIEYVVYDLFTSSRTMVGTPLIRRCVVGNVDGFYIKDFYGSLIKIAKFTGNVSQILTDFELGFVDNTIILGQTSKVLQFGTTTTKSRIINMLNNTYEEAETSAHFLIKKVTRIKE